MYNNGGILYLSNIVGADALSRGHIYCIYNNVPDVSEILWELLLIYHWVTPDPRSSLATLPFWLSGPLGSSKMNFILQFCNYVLEGDVMSQGRRPALTFGRTTKKRRVQTILSKLLDVPLNHFPSISYSSDAFVLTLWSIRFKQNMASSL